MQPELVDPDVAWQLAVVGVAVVALVLAFELDAVERFSAAESFSAEPTAAAAVRSAAEQISAVLAAVAAVEAVASAFGSIVAAASDDLAPFVAGTARLAAEPVVVAASPKRLAAPAAEQDVAVDWEQANFVDFEYLGDTCTLQLSLQS